MSEPSGTTMASDEASSSAPCEAPTILNGVPAAWAKIGGVSPTPPMSMASALMASSSGGPAAKLVHSMS